LQARQRGDQKSRYESYKTGIGNGFLSPNDVRRLENMNPIEGGDVYLVPLNMTTLDKAGQDPVENKPSGNSESNNVLLELDNRNKETSAEYDSQIAEARAAIEERDKEIESLKQNEFLNEEVRESEKKSVRDSFIQLLESAAEECLIKERAALRKAAVQYKDDTGSFSKWMDGFYERHERTTCRAIGPAIENYIRLNHAPESEFHLTQENIDGVINEIANQFIERSRKKAEDTRPEDFGHYVIHWDCAGTIQEIDEILFGKPEVQNG